MKKFFLLFALCLTIGAAKLSAVDNLYVYGNAMGDGIVADVCEWRDDKAPLMYAEGNDVFTFTAYFAADDKEFKFISATDTYFNAAGATGVLDLTAGGTLTTDPEKGDNKFKMAEAGWYKITCDLQAMTIKAEKKENGSEQPMLYRSLYMVGDPTPGGWNVNNGYRMDYQGGSLYATDVYLNATGSFKVTLDQTKGFDNNYYFFRDATDANKVSRDNTDDSDRQWSVAESGTYRVAINLADSSISITKQDFGGNLYMVGDAVSGGWDLNSVPMMNQDGNVFTYTGWIEADKEFKFLVVRDLIWDNVMQLVNAAGETGYLADGQANLKAAVNVKENDVEVNDDKFKLPAESGSGNYRVTCDLNAMTVKVEKVAYQETHIQHAALYMVGTATPDNEQAETFPEKAVKLVSNEDNTYSAQGVELKEGVFKLLTACDLGWSTTHLHPDVADNGKISTDGTDDRKWTISEAGVYDITANLADSTITITKQTTGPGTSFEAVSADHDVRIVSNQGALEVFLPGQAARIDLFDATGRVVASVAEADGYALVGNGLHPGIYVLRMTLDGKTLSQKALVK